MGILNIFKKRKAKEESAVPAKKEEKKNKDASDVAGKSEEKAAVKKEKSSLSKEKKSDTGDAYRILLRPLVTEKAADLGAAGKYVFEVARKAGKIEIKKAIKMVYGVEPIKVNIVSMGGKRRRFGRTVGHTRDWKKAVVTLRPGEKIEVYEGV